MIIYVLPISGGGFAVQMGLLKAINDASDIIPDLVLASSGGNVAAYVAMISNWRGSGIVRNSYFLHSKLFVESWVPPFLPTWLATPLTKSVYRSGTGIKELFHRMYTESSIKTTEIWTGTYNADSQKAATFCNKSEESALIKHSKPDAQPDIFDSEKSVYLNGNIEEIAKTCYASASIPYITPGVIINGERHVDGGTAYGSPLIPLGHRLADALKARGPGERIQMHHFSSYDMAEIFPDNLYSNSIGILVHSSLVKDRAAVLSFVREFGVLNPTSEVYRDMTSSKLRPIMKKIQKRSYVMMLSPKKTESLNLSTFRPMDIIRVIKNVEKEFTVRIYFLN